ncbi:PAS domain-containing protein [Sphingomonas yantingensis]|uniref:histidine kinase n=1 Tax=Sphingomonas yantingensis TaxID=1241761 RepID=A0A7W9AQR2_9SPHN|nr:PAS domain-containing protein [Sphingomonas yantingensis]MBB5698681.1 PAS domain S-box-containing protein [Sphingomonas yantingensis]
MTPPDAPLRSPPLRDWTEAERIEALDDYGILDTPAEADFDEIAQLAADALEAPIALVSLVSRDRQWFKSEVGFGERETPIGSSVCAHALRGDGFLVVPDLTADPRFVDNPLVAAPDGIRFYCGAVLYGKQGLPLGTLCVIDRVARPAGVTSAQRRLLELLARQVVAQIELRRAIDDARSRREERQAVEARYQLAASATTDAIWDWDLLTDRVQWNAALETAYGHHLDAAETEGDWWLSRVHPDDRGHVARSIEAAIARGDAGWAADYRFVRADGTYAPVYDRGSILRDESGRAVRMVGAMLDLTERRAHEAELRASNARFRAAVDAIDGYVWTNTPEGEMHGDQPGWHALTGQSEAEYSGYGWTAAVHPEDVEPSIAAWKAALATRGMYAHEHRVRTARGEWRRFATRAVPMIGEDGSLLEWVGIHTDVTERREQQAALRESQARLQFLDDLGRATAEASVPDAIMATTTRMMAERMRVANCAYADIDPDGDGFTIRGDWSRNAAHSLVGHYRLSDYGEEISGALHAGRTVVLSDIPNELTGGAAAKADSLQVAATVCVPLIRHGRFVAMMAVHDDVPHAWTDEEVALVAAVAERSWAHIERVSAARELAELNASLEARVAERSRELLVAEEALRQAQKMEAVGQLTGGIAHDFNNLLTIVIGSVDIARRALGVGDAMRATRAMGNAQKGAERAAALTQRLLAFSRRQPLDPKPLDVGRLVDGMLDLVNRALGETVSLEVVGDPALWRVEADPNQLENAILNLAVNARDAMPEGGRLVIETRNARVEPGDAAEVAPGDYVMVAVTDTGTGMSRDTLGRVFEPFFTTKDVGRGTGLGLSQVYGFVRQSGGQVKIFSQEHVGTTVRIYLPRLHREGEAPEDEAIALAAAPSRQDETIMVVEDDDDVRAYTVEVLRELGYRVLEAHDGMTALRLLERRETAIDLLFTDVVMPGMSGSELVERARELKAELKVLYASGYTRNAIMQGGRLEPGVELIAKPFTYESLARKIRDVLEV